MTNRFRWWSPRTAAAIIASGLAIGGVVLIGTGIGRHPKPPPQPAPSAAGTIVVTSVPRHPTARPHRTSRTTTTTIAGMVASPPVEIDIPKLGVRSVIVNLDRNPDGTVQVPASFHVAGWYEHSVTPGQTGPSVIVGHVDSTSGPGVFYRLGTLTPGDHVTVTRADHRTVSYVITGVRQYPKSAFPTLDVYGNTPTPTIRLVTCGGTFDNTTGHYLSNIVAYGQATPQN